MKIKTNHNYWNRLTFSIDFILQFSFLRNNILSRKISIFIKNANSHNVHIGSIKIRGKYTDALFEYREFDFPLQKRQF